MNTKVLVIADEPAFQRWLQNVEGVSLDTCMITGNDPAELMTQVALQDHYALVFCEFSADNCSQRSAFVEQFQARYWQVPVIGLGTTDHADCVLAAMRAGASDFIVLNRDDALRSGQITRLLRRATATVAPPSNHGRLFLALTSHPHESIAFFAEHLALAIGERSKADERVLLVDLATPSGAAGIFLNLSPRYHVLDAVHDAARCNAELIERSYPKHASGLYLLSLPEDLIGRAYFDTEQLLRLLLVLRDHFAHIVVCIDGFAPVGTIVGLIEAADRSLLLSDQSILESRHNKYFLRALRSHDCGLERMALVVDNYRRRLGLEPRNLSALFDLPLIATLQTESFNRLLSMNSGEPMFTLARKDPFCAGIRTLAAMLLSGELAPALPQPGFLDRMLR